MKKKALYRDIRKSFANSKGRFISILCLIALGSFALVGLQVTGPNMRKTVEHFTQSYHTADLSVIGSMGMDEETKKAIEKISDTTDIAYGYLKDVVISDTTDSIRIFSETKNVSGYEVISGRMPKSDKEVALSNAMSSHYTLGDKISFTEKADISGKKVLKNDLYTIVGFVNSSELFSQINLGQSTAGTGELQGYAVVTREAFDCDYTMIARLCFEDTKNIDPYSNEYTQRIQKHRDELEKLLENQPQKRMDAIKEQYEDEIEAGKTEIADAKQKLRDGREKLEDAGGKIKEARNQITDSKTELKNKVAQAQKEIDANEKKLQSAQKEINDGQTQLTAAKNQIDRAQQEIQQNEMQLKTAKNRINDSEASLSEKKQTYQTQQDVYHKSEAEWLQNQKNLKDTQHKLEQGKAEYEAGIVSVESQIDSLKKAMQAPSLTENEKTGYQAKLAIAQQQLTNVKTQYETFLKETYNPKIAAVQSGQKTLSEKKTELDAAKQQLDAAASQIATAEEQLETGKATLSQNEVSLQNAKNTLSQKQKEYDRNVEKLSLAKQQVKEGTAALQNAKSELAAQTAEGEQKIADAESELKKKQKQYKTKVTKYQKKKAKADTEIPKHEKELKDAQKKIERMELPTFSVRTRREIPGSEGYRIYSNISTIADSLARVFPIIMYFVAALVTLTTMTRFVDEQRLQAGTLKALGYGEWDIIRKFTLYGLLSGMSGAILGIILGHVLLPYIVYNTYHTGFSVPEMELHFYPMVTLEALCLALLSAVVPAYLVAKKMLREKPSSLMLPKAPSAGSKIVLERIKPVWKHLSFTHKVTARNIFRYKKRMLMTIFGVCGAVTLLFAGVSVQHAIANINNRQFHDILHYDLIAAENSNLDKKEKEEIQNLLHSDEVKQSLPIYYTELNKTAGKKKDKQEIKLMVTKDTENFSKFITLNERKSGKPITLDTDGVVLSERLAKLLKADVGDTVTFFDDDFQSYSMRVCGITEMYTGHFAFLNANYYKTVFQKKYIPNANFIILKDHSSKAAKTMANEFMQLNGIEGIVQNTTMTNQINTIVESLNKIMTVLVLVAVLLAVVILYNLTNINVMERIRELSTIRVLGFYDKEVTLYIYRETILLTLLGILIGYAIGNLFFRYLLLVVPPEDVMFNPQLGISAFVVPLVLISIITALLGVFMNRKLKRLDMLEALKSVE